MGCVFGTLEVYLAEGIALRKDVASARTVEHRYGIVAANLNRSIDYLLEIAAVEIFACPRSEEEYLCIGVFLNKSLAEYCKPRLIYVDASHGIEHVGVVMAANNNDIVEGVFHLLIAQIHGGAEAAAVVCHAITVAAVVVILHSVLLGKLVVPRVFNRLTMVAHVAVAYNAYLLVFFLMNRRTQRATLLPY